MLNHEDYYSMKESLQNLMLLKLAFDHGVDTKDYPDYKVYNDFNYDNRWSIFFKAIESLFTNVECHFPYNENHSDKEYWIKLTNENSFYVDDLEDLGLIVLLDEQINHEKLYRGTLGSAVYDYVGFTIILPIEHGLVVVWNEDDGPIDLVELFYALTEVIPVKKERTENEVVIGVN